MSIKNTSISLFTNGTLPLLTALQALLIIGEVITTPYSFVATTHSSAPLAASYVQNKMRQGLKVAYMEGVAYRNGRISDEKMRAMLKNQYGQYLLKGIDEMKGKNKLFFPHEKALNIYE